MVDIGTGRMTVAAGGLTREDAISLLALGRGDGTWNGGAGIVSTAAAAAIQAGMLRTIGWVANEAGSMTFSYAVPGDTNLDRALDILDAANMVGGGTFNSGLAATWSDGDFNYDGVFDIVDVAHVMAAGLLNRGPYDTSPAGSIAAVPEPSVTGLACIGISALALLTRRCSSFAGRPLTCR